MNSYLAIRTAGTTQNSDYVWQTSSLVQGELHVELSRKCDPDTRSYAISRRGDSCDVFIGGVQSGLFDYRQRAVMVSVAFIGLTESAARALVTYAIDKQDQFEQGLNASVSRISAGDWDVEWLTVEALVELAKNSTLIHPNAAPMTDAWERFYIAPLESDMPSQGDLARAGHEMQQLVQELTLHALSPGDGLKILVSRNPSQQGYDLARQEADRFLWSEGQNVELTALRKKKAPSGYTQSETSKEPSKTHSSGGACLPRSGPSRDGCWIVSNKGLLIICGVVVIGIVLAATCKKKDHEAPVVKPAPTGAAGPNDKQSAGDKGVPPATSEQNKLPQNQNEEGSTAADGDNKTLKKPEPVKP